MIARHDRIHLRCNFAHNQCTPNIAAWQKCILWWYISLRFSHNFLCNSTLYLPSLILRTKNTAKSYRDIGLERYKLAKILMAVGQATLKLPEITGLVRQKKPPITGYLRCNYRYLLAIIAYQVQNFSV